MAATLPSGPITPLQKQLFFQASRRSMSEMERILERFIDSKLTTLDDDACRRLLDFLNHSDPDILDWIMGVISPPTAVDVEVISWLISFRSEVG